MVGVGVSVGTELGLWVAVGVDDRVGVAVKVTVGVTVHVGVLRASGSRVAVAVGSRGVIEALGVEEGVGVRVGSATGMGVNVGDGDGDGKTILDDPPPLQPIVVTKMTTKPTWPALPLPLHPVSMRRVSLPAPEKSRILAPALQRPQTREREDISADSRFDAREAVHELARLLPPQALHT